MPPLTASDDELDALAAGRAEIDLDDHRAVLVRGGDARAWLHDLVTADVASLETGATRRSLLLDAAGHVRADVLLVGDETGIWLVQDRRQPTAVDALFAPYVLSADVTLDDRTGGVRALARSEGPTGEGGGEEGGEHAGPAALWPGPVSVLPSDASPPDGRRAVGHAAAEVDRIRRGIPRMAVDFDERAIPAALGLAPLIDAAKGCFLGQESVARVRNLGHPPWVLRHMTTSVATIGAGATVLGSDGEPTGRITSSAAGVAGGATVLATARWPDRTGPLGMPGGAILRPVGSSD